MSESRQHRWAKAKVRQQLDSHRRCALTWRKTRLLAFANRHKDQFLELKVSWDIVFRNGEKSVICLLEKCNMELLINFSHNQKAIGKHYVAMKCEKMKARIFLIIRKLLENISYEIWKNES